MKFEEVLPSLRQGKRIANGKNCYLLNGVVTAKFWLRKSDLELGFKVGLADNLGFFLLFHGRETQIGDKGIPDLCSLLEDDYVIVDERGAMISELPQSSHR